MDDSPTRDNPSYREGVINAQDYKINKKDNVIMTTKSINIDSSNDGDHYRNYCTELVLTNSNYVPPKDPLHHQK